MLIQHTDIKTFQTAIHLKAVFLQTKNQMSF